MLFSTKNVGSNYLARIVKLPAPYKHPNADRLQLVNIQGSVVVTGMNAKEGDLYVYFPLESRLNSEYLKWSNSYSDSTLNADQTKKGYFGDKGRVKAQKLRGQPSEGYIVPLQDIESFFIKGLGCPDTFELDAVGENFNGIEFDTINHSGLSILICEKYVPPMQYAKGPKNMPKKDKRVRHNRIVDGQFRFHVDTAQLKKNIHSINPTDTITITEKLHGTSLVCSRVLVNRELKWYEKLLKRIGIKIQDKEYGMVYSSRSVIKNKYTDKDPGGFYKEDVWGAAAKRLEPALKDGITFYAEIVGFTTNGGCIQKGYDYGCKQGEFEVYVYRMTYTNPAGDVLELNTNQIKNYCDKFGLKMVPIHYHGEAQHFVDFYPGDYPQWEANGLLEILTKEFLEKKCGICKNDVPNEGVVVTVERDQFTAYKLKSFAFFERESKELDSGEVDLETQQSIVDNESI